MDNQPEKWPIRRQEVSAKPVKLLACSPLIGESAPARYDGGAAKGGARVD